VQPEYDDARAAAARTGRPVAELLAEARAAAYGAQAGDGAGHPAAPAERG
jgi:uncharacterized protein (DUF111 family)